MLLFTLCYFILNRELIQSYSYDDDNHHMTVVNQNNVQDVMWLDDAAIEVYLPPFASKS